MAIEKTYLLGKNITLGCGFDLQAKAPLDSRQVVPEYDGLQALIDGNAAYEGMIVYDEGTKKTYQAQLVDGVLAFREFGINEAELKALIASETTAAMEFKGAATALPENPSKGDFYKVTAEFEVTEGETAKIGDSIVYDGEQWFLIPSGDDIEDTWRPVTDVDNDASLTFAAGDKLDVAVAANGTVTYSHEAIDAPELLAENEQTRTYITAVETDGYGHITGYKTATENVEDTNTTYEFEGMPVGEGEEAPSSVYFQVKSSDEDAAEVIYLDAYNKNEVDGKFVADADLGAKVDALVSECEGATGRHAYEDLSALVLQTWTNTEDINVIKDEETGILAQAKAYAAGLVTNDLTDELKEQYDAAYEHSQVAHAPANAQENVIEAVMVNNVAQPIGDKAVWIEVPTGALANKDEVTKDDLADALAMEINAKMTEAEVDARIDALVAAVKDPKENTEQVAANLEELVQDVWAAQYDAQAAMNEASSKVAMVTAGDRSITIGGEDTNPTVAAKISAEDGNALTLAEDGLKVIIPESTKVEASETNGNIKVDGQEVIVYTHPDKHDIADVDGLQQIINDMVSENELAGLVDALVAAVKDPRDNTDQVAASLDALVKQVWSNQYDVSMKANANEVYTKTETYTQDEVDAAIAAAKTETANQDAVVLAESQKYTNQAKDDAIADAEGKINALADNVYIKEQTYTKAEVDALLTWGEF